MVRGTRFWERLGRVTFQAAVAGAFVFHPLLPTSGKGFSPTSLWI